MPGNDTRAASPANFEDWVKQGQSFERLAAYTSATMNMTGRGEPQMLAAAAVSHDFFGTLGVPALKGRTFAPEDARADGGGVVILSHGLWQTYFGSDPTMLGQQLSLDGKSHVVVGIMPSHFSFPARTALWVLGYRGGPMPPSFVARFPSPDAVAAQRDIHNAQVIGRLKPQVSIETAQAEMSGIARRLALEYPKTNAGLGVNIVPLHEKVVGSSKPTLFVLLGAVGLVLLIACANVANLLVARALEREREVAIRMALGAGRWSLIRQLLTESLILSFAGGVVGLLVALWATNIFVSLTPGDIPRIGEAGVDGRLLFFTCLIALITGVACAAIPALHCTKVDPQNSLQDGGTRATEGHGRRRTQRYLVVAEIAVTQVLLVGAGLLIMTFVRLQTIDVGFNPAGLLTGRVSLSGSEYSEAARKIGFYDQVLGRLQSIPGVSSAALVMNLPLSGGTVNRGFRIEGQPEPKADENITVDYQLISPGYFTTMKIPLLDGRLFTEADGETAPRVAMINQIMARKYFPGQNPIGKRIAFGDPARQESWRTIVGIVGDVRYESADEPAFPGAYTPYRQNTEPWSRMFVVLRAHADPASFATALRGAILAVDPNQPLTHVQSMEEVMASGLARQRFLMLLIATLGGVALALSALGVYGILAYSVGRRTHEIGIRMALGARKRHVLGMIVREGMTLTLAGVGLGIVGAFALTRMIARMLFGIAPHDPSIVTTMSLLLLFVTLLACYLPARRAAALDPMKALGHGQ
jgi:putative ABC transport system permease protein